MHLIHSLQIILNFIRKLRNISSIFNGQLSGWLRCNQSCQFVTKGGDRHWCWKVWRYGESMPDKQLSLLGEKTAETCFWADISRHRLQRQHRPHHLWLLLQVSLRHTAINLTERERCAGCTKERQKMEMEQDNEHKEMEMWKQREGIKR